MTTIAWDGTTLASDWRVTAGSSTSNVFKIQKVSKSEWLAGAGNIVSVQKLMDYMRDKSPDKVKPSVKGCHFMLLDTLEGKCYYMDSKLVKVECRGKWSVGSGADYARGAMEAGKTAVEAIVITSRLDAYTGGGVDSVSKNGRKVSLKIKG